MKKWFFSVLFLVLALSGCAYAADLEIKGVWVSTVYNLDYPSAAGLSAEQLQSEADAIIQKAYDNGMNAIFLQVRPAADAIYRSALQPWSKYLSGTQGQAPDGGFDPLAYFISACHKKGLQLHAWINPYRITRTAADSRDAAFAQLSANHPARTLQDSVVFHSDGCLYFDPGKPAVRQHILDTVKEILDNYDVDGIHMDDYFYPGSEFEDSATYQVLGGDFSDVGDFRRDAVNQLVSALHDLVEQEKPEAVFGVSPAGIWASAANKAMGCDTTGSETYFDHYADSRRWVRENLVDYIMPQLYWEVGAAAGDFQMLLNWWSAAAEGTDVKLYIGLAAYRIPDAPAGTVWYGSDELVREIELIQASPNAAGAVLFRYGSVQNRPEVLEALRGLFSVQPQPETPLYPTGISISSPTHAQFVQTGASVALACTAPRGSRVSALWKGTALPLTYEGNGAYAGVLTPDDASAEGGAAPVLLCAEKNGFLFIQLLPGSVTPVAADQPASVTDIDWSAKDEGHQVIFHTATPCPLDWELSGDVLTLTLSPCRLAVRFEDNFFVSVTVSQTETTSVYRLVLPDQEDDFRCFVDWSADEIRLSLKTTPPAE